VARFLIDENLPRSLAPLFRRAGIDAEDIRDSGPRGQTDEAIFAYARINARSLLTADRGFGNLMRFPLGSHSGIVVARFPNDVAVLVLNDAVLQAVQSLSEDDLVGNLVIIEPGRLRLRRRP
jgi:predicted nuclease of predicted toxin-antitoxin system